MKNIILLLFITIFIGCDFSNDKKYEKYTMLENDVKSLEKNVEQLKQEVINLNKNFQNNKNTCCNSESKIVDIEKRIKLISESLVDIRTHTITTNDVLHIIRKNNPKKQPTTTKSKCPCCNGNGNITK